MSAAHDFLAALFDTCDAGIIETRGYPSGSREWLTLRQWGTLQPFVERCARIRDNVAVGVATRKDTTSGRTDNLLQLPALFVDLDVRPAEAIRRLDTFAFTPHVIVESGLGVHGYFRLKEPLAVSDRQSCEHAAGLLRRLAHSLNGDPRATDPARVLRVPTTLNFKYGDPPRPVVLATLRPGALDAAELDDFLPREIHASRAFLSEGAIPEGTRNDCLYRYGRSLRARGTRFSDIARALETLNNTRCHPPLPALELSQLLKQVLTQPDRADFQPPARYRAGQVLLTRQTPREQHKQEKQGKQEGGVP